MRGLRRVCVGITVFLFAWSTQPTWAQSQPGSSSRDSAGGLSWPPPGLNYQPPSAQGGPPPGYQPGPYPPGAGMPPGMMPPGAMPPPGGMPPGGMPPGGMPPYGAGAPMQPYPGTDMYRYGFQQTINENGLWFSEKRNHSREYKVSVDLLVPIYGEAGDTLFGYGGIDTGIGSTDGIPPFYFSSPRSPGTVSTGGGTGGGSTSAIDQQLLDRYFPFRTFDSMFEEGNSSTGIKLNWGFENEDGSGFYINGWYGGDSTQTFQRGAVPTRNYIPTIDPFGLPGNDPLYILQLNALNGSLPINNGAGVAERITFDALYEMKFSQSAWGAGLKILRPAIAKSDWYQVRPVVGLRYIDIRESFAFRGLDSGAEYEIINYNDIDYAQEFETLFNLDLGFVTVGNESIGEAGFEGRPDAGSFNDDDFVPSPSFVNPLIFSPTNPYETQVSARNHARVAGPEIGLQTDLGEGDGLVVSFMATAGLMATSENMRLNGFGVYNHFVNRVDPDANIETPDGGQIGTGLGGVTDAETAFTDKANTTHVSPTFDLSVSAEFPIFEYIPGVRRLGVLENAKFRTSYGFLYVGNISRPQDSVTYVTYPINPSLDPQRSGWTMQQWTFGIDWNY